MKVETDTEGPKNRNFSEIEIANTSAAAYRHDKFSVAASE
jgi:hypothetical protein